MTKQEKKILIDFEQKLYENYNEKREQGKDYRDNDVWAWVVVSDLLEELGLQMADLPRYQPPRK